MGSLPDPAITASWVRRLLVDAQPLHDRLAANGSATWLTTASLEPFAGSVRVDRVEAGGAWVLQIVTKMYFRKGVDLHTWTHREVLYTNRWVLPAELVTLPVGELLPSTSSSPVLPVTLTVTEYLEAEYPDGTPSMLIATGGHDLIDDLADVLSFKLDAVFHRDHDLVTRLVPTTTNASRPSPAAKHFRRTFEPSRVVEEAELAELRSFFEHLLGLERSYFERAMRAVRRIVRATRRAAEDPTLAYVDLVAALESLSDDTEAASAPWEKLNGRVRQLVDHALEGAEPSQAEGVRKAVIEAERVGARSRFVGFVLSHISPAYYREEATDAVQPLAGAELERALKLAYDVRSRSVHSLEDLPPEAWELGDRGDTASPPGMGTMLSLEGFARLARHVVGNYVDRAPAGVDADFDWRASLPGQLRMRLAPQYWIWQTQGFGHASVPRYFAGFIEHMAEKASGNDEPIADMRAVLEKIEQMLPGTADGQVKTMMVAIYSLWHRLTADELHRPDPQLLLAENQASLERPSIHAFAVALLVGELAPWTTEELLALARERREERSRRAHLELPAKFDSALQVLAAERAQSNGREEEARELARFAVEDSPGDVQLMAWETDLNSGEYESLDIGALVFSFPARNEPGDTAEPQGDEAVAAEAPGPGQAQRQP